MPVYIDMPKLSDTMTEGVLVKWLKNEGDSIESGDVLAEIETDKATMEMECFEDGVVYKQMIKAGGKAPIGTTIAVILEEGEEPPSDEEIAAAESARAAAAPAEEPVKEAAAPAPAGGASEPAAAPKAAAAPATLPDGSKVKASPLAKKIAQKEGVNLATLRGSGPGGRIVKKDVLAAVVPEAPPAGAAPAFAPIPVPKLPGDTEVPLSGMRRIIAERLSASKTQIPHFYLNIEVDAGPLMSARKQINEDAEKTKTNKYSVNDFILKAVVNAAAAVPAINASWGGDHIVQHASVGLSVAIAVEDGLVTPVILEAEKKTLLQISEQVKELAEKARSKKLGPDAYDGGTITVSTLGAWGIDTFSAIINPPQAAILSVGAIVKKPVVDDKGEIVPGLRMNIGLSGDHRVVDGAVGAEYLAEVRKLIENPALMLV